MSSLQFITIFYYIISNTQNEHNQLKFLSTPAFGNEETYNHDHSLPLYIRLNQIICLYWTNLSKVPSPLLVGGGNKGTYYHHDLLPLHQHHTFKYKRINIFISFAAITINILSLIYFNMILSDF